MAVKPVGKDWNKDKPNTWLQAGTSYTTDPSSRLGPGQSVKNIDGTYIIVGNVAVTSTARPTTTTTNPTKPTTTTTIKSGSPVPTTLPVYNPNGGTALTIPAGYDISIPDSLAAKYKLPKGQKIIYIAPKDSGLTSGTPQSGPQLYEAITRDKNIPDAMAKELVDNWFGSGFKFGATHYTDALRIGYNNVATSATKYGNTNQVATFSAANLTPAQINQISMNQAAESQRLQLLGITLGQSQAKASSEASAYATISSYLNRWGLAAESKNVYDMVMHSGDHIINTDALLAAVRGQAPSGLGPKVDAALKSNYDKVFVGLDQYNKAPGAINMTEDAYMAYTQSITNTATQYGAPMPTPDQIGKLLNGHVSASEYSQRVTDIYAAVSNADQNVKNQLQTQYGIGPGDLMHYFMDPKNALQTMQRRVAGAQIGDYASRVGLGGLSADQTSQLADMAKLSAVAGNNPLGYGVNQIQGSLLTAAKDIGLTRATPGAAPATIDTTQLIGSQLAGFGGTNQAAEQVQVGRAEQAKAAPFEKGGGYAENAKGVIGLGSART